jgi:Fe-S-cluster containining protein
MQDLTIKNQLRDPEKVQKILGGLNQKYFMTVASQVLFECENCGKCCEGGCTNVTFDTEDCSVAANFLGISRKKFMVDYTLKHPRAVNFRVMKDTQKSESCIFRDIKNKKCKIYGGRSKICRIYPMMNIDDKNNDNPHIYFECNGTMTLVNKMIDYQQKNKELCETFVENQNKEKDPTLDLLLKVLWLKGIQFIHGEEYSKIAAQTLDINWQAVQDNIESIKMDLMIFICGVTPIGHLEKLKHDWIEEQRGKVLSICLEYHGDDNLWLTISTA